ncbi:MAG: hypothetical protein QGG36_22540 [Pirellulaceae bacterium]|nr:hypothetical protein [Pirellulaceae bacterium]
MKTWCWACALLIGLSLTTRASAAELELVWEVSTGKHLPLAVLADDRQRPYLYVAQKSGGLSVLNASRNSARSVASLGVAQFRQMDVMNLAQHGDLLLLALGGHFSAQGTKHAGMAIVSVANPARPKVLSVWRSPEKLKGGAVIATDGRRAYLGAMSAGVMIFDISKPARIRQLSAFQPDVNFPRPNPGKIQHPNSRGLAIRKNLLFVANDAGGLRVLDVKNPNKPIEIGRYVNAAMTRKQQAYNNVILDGNRAFIAVDYAGLEIVDISNPRKMKQIGWWNPWDAHTLKNLWVNSPGHTNQLSFDSKRKLVYLSAGDSELQVVDVSKPQSPRLVSHYGKPKNKLGVWGLATSSDRVFLTYIKTFVPFQSGWSGVKAVRR